MSSLHSNQAVSENEKVLLRVSANTLLGNILLSVLKGAAGILAHSGAMVSDAVHSASDVFSTVVVMIGYHLSEKTSDETHPYGHERLECVAAILLAAVLAATGAGIGICGLCRICRQETAALLIPGRLALLAAILSIVGKEAMYWYTRAAAVKIGSSALLADAWHHRSDALSSVGSLIGIAGARAGMPLCDPIAGMVIAGFIIKAAYDIFRDAIGKMTDRACDRNTGNDIYRIALGVEGVCGIDRLQTRVFGSRIYVDLEIAADAQLTLESAHRIAHAVHDEVEHRLTQVKHCMVHVNPAAQQQAEKPPGD